MGNHYHPVRDGIERGVRLVSYLEVPPPPRLAHLVHCVWELKTKQPLPRAFRYHVVPDACVNLLFSQTEPEVVAVTKVHTRAVELNLGRAFHFCGVQLQPGCGEATPRRLKTAWSTSPMAVCSGF